MSYHLSKKTRCGLPGMRHARAPPPTGEMLQLPSHSFYGRAAGAGGRRRRRRGRAPAPVPHRRMYSLPPARTRRLPSAPLRRPPRGGDAALQPRADGDPPYQRRPAPVSDRQPHRPHSGCDRGGIHPLRPGGAAVLLEKHRASRCRLVRRDRCAQLTAVTAALISRRSRSETAERRISSAPACYGRGAIGTAGRCGAWRPESHFRSLSRRAHVDSAQDGCLEHDRRRGLAGPAGRNREAPADDEWGITLRASRYALSEPFVLQWLPGRERVESPRFKQRTRFV